MHPVRRPLNLMMTMQNRTTAAAAAGISQFYQNNNQLKILLTHHVAICKLHFCIAGMQLSLSELLVPPSPI